MAATDYAQAILDYLDSEWVLANLTGRFKPKFSPDWAAEAWSQRRVILIRELTSPETVEELTATYRRVDSVFQLDLFADARQDVLDMRGEVDRIIRATPADPITGIALMVQQRWVDNSFLERETYRMTLELLVTMYVGG